MGSECDVDRALSLVECFEVNGMWQWFTTTGLVLAFVGSVAHTFPGVLLSESGPLKRKLFAVGGVRVTAQRLAGLLGGIVIGAMLWTTFM